MMTRCCSFLHVTFFKTSLQIQAALWTCAPETAFPGACSQSQAACAKLSYRFIVLQVTTTTKTTREIQYIGPDGQPINYMPGQTVQDYQPQYQDYQVYNLIFWHALWATFCSKIHFSQGMRLQPIFVWQKTVWHGRDFLNQVFFPGWKLTEESVNFLLKK